jgi:hypothetical protein
MTHLAISMFGDPEITNFGMWLFLSVGAVALFVVFIPTVTWLDLRRKEREAFYKAETFRRLAEASGDSAKAALELLREEGRIKAVKTREGIKIGGVINVGVGLSLVIFLHALLGPHGPDNGSAGPVYLCGLIPGFIGIAMLVYVYFLAAPVDGGRG